MFDEKTLAERDGDDAAVMAACAALLPEGDAGLVEAERRIRKLLDLSYRQNTENDADGAPWAVTFERVIELDQMIAEQEPRTLVGAAVKLRRLLDTELGLEMGNKESDLPALQQVLAFIEREAEKVEAR